MGYVYPLYKRILVGILLGNTDMHLKNFAMFHTAEGLRLTPTYDQVAAVLYDYKTLALTLGGKPHFRINQLKPNHIIQLAKEFNLQPTIIPSAIDAIEKNLAAAKHAIAASTVGSSTLKNNLIISGRNHRCLMIAFFVA